MTIVSLICDSPRRLYDVCNVLQWASRQVSVTLSPPPQVNALSVGHWVWVYRVSCTGVQAATSASLLSSNFIRPSTHKFVHQVFYCRIIRSSYLISTTNTAGVRENRNEFCGNDQFTISPILCTVYSKESIGSNGMVTNRF